MGPRRKAFSLIELLVVIAVIAVLMGILLPALNRAREMGKRIACLNNLKNLALVWHMYADSNDGKLPSGHTRGKDCWVDHTDLEYFRNLEHQELAIKRGLLYPYLSTAPYYGYYQANAGLHLKKTGIFHSKI